MPRTLSPQEAYNYHISIIWALWDKRHTHFTRLALRMSITTAKVLKHTYSIKGVRREA